jgi:hypothetical protein
MKLKHTPGPWWITPCQEILKMPEQIKISNHISGETIQAAKANGLLIAAAPEMLNALIFSYKHSVACGRFGGITDSMKKAIERATGLSIDEVLEAAE